MGPFVELVPVWAKRAEKPDTDLHQVHLHLLFVFHPPFCHHLGFTVAPLSFLSLGLGSAETDATYFSTLLLAGLTPSPFAGLLLLGTALMT